MPAKYTLEQTIAKFWSCVDKSGGEDACWLWTAGRSHKYGEFQWRGRTNRAHRASWEIAFGDIPDGLHVLHDCPSGDNPLCVNPKHLYLGTHLDNMRDNKLKGLAAKGAQSGMCHSMNQRNRRLIPAQVLEIRRRFAEDGATLSSLATEFDVTCTHISYIVHRKVWKWL